MLKHKINYVNRILALLFVGYLGQLVVLAQLNNKAFYRFQEVDSANYKELYLSISHLSFNKDNEYFNKIADGYTLFGNQLAPSLVYYPLKNVRIEAGIFLRKDFGNSKYTEISPLMSIKVNKNDVSLIFGTIEGSLNHGLVEPLYDFERIMTDRNENGLQVILDKKRVKTDAWINWENMLYRGDTVQEKMSGGLSSDFTILSRPGFDLTLPFQFTAMHLGGQIDASPLPLKTVVNAATGFNLEKKLENDFLHALALQPYWLFYQDFSFKKTDVYNEGSALYINLNIKTKLSNVMFSYWRGNQYISTHGGLLYNSRSTTYKNPDFTEKRRELLILRILSDFRLADNFIITTRFEPFYDVNQKKAEFSMGLYINYHDRFSLNQVFSQD